MSNEMDLVEVVASMTLSQLTRTALILDVLGDSLHAHNMRAWARWWLWQVGNIVGEEIGDRPAAVVVAQLSDLELEALRDIFVGVANNHIDDPDPGLRRFAVKVAALALVQLHNRVTEKGELADQLSALRRQRARAPYATPDDAGLPKWSEITRPVDGV